MRRGFSFFFVDAILLIQTQNFLRTHKRFIAECGIWQFQRVLHAGNWNGDVRRHAGEKFQLRIIELNHGVVGDDILHDSGVHAHLGHSAAKGFLRKRVDFEGDLLAWFNVADIGLIGLGVHQHLGQILRDCEYGWRLQ